MNSIQQSENKVNPILTRKNRKTGTLIALHKEEKRPLVLLWDLYQLECTDHGQLSDEYTLKAEAIADMAHPDRWCPECIMVLVSEREEGG